MKTTFIPVGILRHIQTAKGISVAIEGAHLDAIPANVVLFAENPQGDLQYLMQEQVALDELHILLNRANGRDAGALSLARSVIEASRQKVDIAMQTIGTMKAALAFAQARQYADEEASVVIEKMAFNDGVEAAAKVAGSALLVNMGAEILALRKPV